MNEMLVIKVLSPFQNKLTGDISLDSSERMDRSSPLEPNLSFIWPPEQNILFTVKGEKSALT